MTSDPVSGTKQLPQRKAIAFSKASVRPSRTVPMTLEIIARPLPHRAPKQHGMAAPITAVTPLPGRPSEGQVFSGAPSLARDPSTPKMTASFWLLARPELVAGGREPSGFNSLAGSQIGGRVLIPLRAGDGKLRLSLRAAMPLSSLKGLEGAAGFSLRPSHRLPLELIVEERFMLDRPTHPSPAVLVVGGFQNAQLPLNLRAEGYLQAGGVQRGHMIGFLDGRLTIKAAVTETTRIGMGAWVAAQGRVGRVDMGPSISFSYHTLQLSADWRFRLVGQSRPGSGPAITLGKDF